MGAVKTNRRIYQYGITLTDEYPYLKIAPNRKTISQKEIGVKKGQRIFQQGHEGNGLNNRRKMAGLPMIRRAKS